MIPKIKSLLKPNRQDFSSKEEVLQYFNYRTDEIFKDLGYVHSKNKTWYKKHSDDVYTYFGYGAMKGLTWQPYYGFKLAFVPHLEKSVKNDHLYLAKTPATMGWLSADKWPLENQNPRLDLRLNYTPGKPGLWTASKNEIDLSLNELKKCVSEKLESSPVFQTITSTCQKALSDIDVAKGFKFYVANIHLVYALTLKKSGAEKEAEVQFQMFLRACKDEFNPSEKLIKEFTSYFSKLA